MTLRFGDLRRESTLKFEAYHIRTQSQNCAASANERALEALPYEAHINLTLTVVPFFLLFTAGPVAANASLLFVRLFLFSIGSSSIVFLRAWCLPAEYKCALALRPISSVQSPYLGK
jgi:hypothetical protein